MPLPVPGLAALNTPVLGAVLMVARAQLRRRWPGLVAIALLVGLVGGVVG
ncbi:MAG: hypothetical protein IRZ08_13640, partial [Frankia sp.]|nr:hypothetical protein [Frankia sp.]